MRGALSHSPGPAKQSGWVCQTQASRRSALPTCWVFSWLPLLCGLRKANQREDNKKEGGPLKQNITTSKCILVDAPRPKKRRNKEAMSRPVWLPPAWRHRSQAYRRAPKLQSVTLGVDPLGRPTSWDFPLFVCWGFSECWGCLLFCLRC